MKTSLKKNNPTAAVPADAMKIFVVCGTHENEMRFAKPVAKTLAEELAKKRGLVVELVSIPRLGGRFKNYRDEPSMRAYDYLVDRGFEPSNQKHLVIDVHENPVNWKNAYSEFADFYSQHVAKAIEKSQAQGTHGIYFAEIKGKHNYADFRSITRKEITALRKANSRFIRIEVPVVSDNKNVTAHYEKTTRLVSSAKTPGDFVKRISKSILRNL